MTKVERLRQSFKRNQIVGRHFTLILEALSSQKDTAILSLSIDDLRLCLQDLDSYRSMTFGSLETIESKPRVCCYSVTVTTCECEAWKMPLPEAKEGILILGLNE